MRPYRYTLELHQGVVQMLDDGATLEAAANASAVSFSTIYNWLGRGEAAVGRWEASGLEPEERSADPDWEMAQFYLDVTAARGKHLAACAKVVTHSALGKPAEYDAAGNCVREEIKPDPRMALEVLARRDKANWARDAQAPKPTEAEDLEDLARRGEALVAELAALDADG